MSTIEMKSGQRKKIGSLVIGLDCSTTGTKAIAFDRKGRVAARAHESIPLFSPEPHHYEQNPTDWWISAQKTLRRITRQISPGRISALRWSQPILKSLEVTEAQLPGAYCPGTILGKVSTKASKMTGLSTDTMVVAGGGDRQAAGLGGNVLTPERAYLNLGTAVVAGVYGKRYRTSKAFRSISRGMLQRIDHPSWTGQEVF